MYCQKLGGRNWVTFKWVRDWGAFGYLFGLCSEIDGKLNWYID
jgi:hypothetical protein